MGTGIASILLYNLPYNGDWLRYIAIAIFILNIVVFTLLCVGTMVRLIRWKGIFSALGKHTLAGMFWGCLPMGMATIIVSILTYLQPCVYART
jgi:tellurite resistance protein TehA-like permease